MLRLIKASQTYFENNDHIAIIDLIAKIKGSSSQPWGELYLMAWRTKSYDGVRLLFRLGAPLNDGRARGWSRTPLSEALNLGDVDLARELLSLGSIWVPCSGGVSPLFFAVRSGVVEAVNLCLEAWSSYVNSLDNRGRSAIFECLRLSDDLAISILRRLIECGADINIVDKDGHSLLSAALLNNSSVFAQEVAMCGGALADSRFGLVATLLASGDNSFSLPSLLDHVDVDDLSKPDAIGLRTAVELAVQRNNSSELAWLVAKGAFCDEANPYMMPLAIIACENNNHAILKILRDCNAVCPPRDFVANGRIDLLRKHYSHVYPGRSYIIVERQMLEASIAMEGDSLCSFTQIIRTTDDVDAITPRALLRAAEFGRDDIIELIAENGGSIDFCRLRGMSPLALAVKHGHLSTIDLLIRLGADRKWRALDGRGLLHIAAESMNIDVVRLLVSEYGLPIDDIDYNGRTALFSVAHCEGSADIIKALIDLGIDSDRVDSYGNLPTF